MRDSDHAAFFGAWWRITAAALVAGGILMVFTLVVGTLYHAY